MIRRTVRKRSRGGGSCVPRPWPPPARRCPALAEGPAVPAGRRLFAYVGTYSSQLAAEESKGHGKGIYLFEMDPANGALVEGEVFANDANPSWLALNPARTHLYAANNTVTYQGAESGSVERLRNQPRTDI